MVLNMLKYGSTCRLICSNRKKVNILTVDLQFSFFFIVNYLISHFPIIVLFKFIAIHQLYFLWYITKTLSYSTENLYLILPSAKTIMDKENFLPNHVSIK
jgi:hypothetical protein